MKFLAPSTRRLLVLLLSISLILLPLQGRGDALHQLPDIGAASGNLMTPQQERQLGKTFMRYVRATQKVIDDPLLDDYINTLGRSLVENSEARGNEFTFFLVDDPQINAYAGPGGYIGVYTGLLLTTQSESELAAVVAHEIAHVTQKHLLRTWHATSNMSLIQGAALIAALLVGAALGGDAGFATAMGVQAAMQQQQINFTRHNEQEADRIGIAVLQEAGFDPRAMPTFFSRMGRANRSYGTQLPEFLRTHPVTNSRIADSLGRAESHPYRQREDSLRYLLARATLREMSFHEAKDAVHHFRTVLKEGRYRSRDAARYGLVRALYRAQRYDEAAKQVLPLLDEHPDTLEFIVTASLIDMDRGKHRQAIERLEEATSRFPFSFPLQSTLAELYLRDGKPAAAYKNLSRLASFNQENMRIHKLLAQAAADLGKNAESHQHLATHYYLMGALEAAQLQLKIALRDPDIDHYRRARIESQLDKVSAELEELKREEKKG